MTTRIQLRRTKGCANPPTRVSDAGPAGPNAKVPATTPVTRCRSFVHPVKS
jgi:hypothetical protein